jgi:hypothetical protein
LKAELIVSVGTKKESLDISEYDLDKPLARALLINNITKIIEKLKNKNGGKKKN